MEKKRTTISELANQVSLAPQEALLDVAPQKNKLYIGIPKEVAFQENRVALSPASVALLVNNGHQVIMESKVGERAGFSDQMYSESGAKIVYDTKEVFEANIILKVAPPTLSEIDFLKPGQTIFSALHLPTLTTNHIQKLMNKKVTAVSYEYIQDDSGLFPMVRTLSEIAGHAALLIAAEYLSNVNEGHGILLGGISGVPPAKVVILGAGVVGECATRTALGLGAEVRIFDNNLYKLMRLKNNVNAQVYTSVINPTTLMQELHEADVLIGAIHSESGRSPIIVTEEMVSNMKEGAVIVDVSIDQGGCIETSRVTTHLKPVFTQYGVIHYCVPNIASRVAKTASLAFSNVLTPILLKVNEYGGFEKLLSYSQGTRNGVYIYKGRLTNHHLSQRFELKYTDLNLLMSASF